MAVLGLYLILSFDLAAVIALLALPLFSLNESVVSGLSGVCRPTGG